MSCGDKCIDSTKKSDSFRFVLNKYYKLFRTKKTSCRYSTCISSFTLQAVTNLFALEALLCFSLSLAHKLDL